MTRTDVGDQTTVERTELDPRLEQYRRELTGYSYRMLGSASEAEDAVQETMVRAWRNLDRFEGRSSLRSWLYRIATNVCIDHLNGRRRRARPMDLGPSTSLAGVGDLGAMLPEATWVEPMPDARMTSMSADPGELSAHRESVRLAFVAALQYLPPKQRAVLILREVLRWKADEVAELLDTTVASVNSALQRARATLDKVDVTSAVGPTMDDEQRALLERYVDAFERYDMAALTALLHQDATLSMPPFALWMQGIENVVHWLTGPGADCAGSRLVATSANGCPAFGQYRRSTTGTGHDPWALQVLEISDARITSMTAFLDTERLYPLFGLPDHLD